MSGPRTVAEALLALEDEPQLPLASFDDGTALTRGEVIGRAAALCEVLAAAGLGPGDRILLVLDNGPAFLDAWFACALGGLVMVPINTRLHGELLDDIVRRSGARAVIADARYVDRLALMHPAPAARIVVGAPVDGWADHAALISGTAPLRPANVHGPDPLSIVFTSGTTGPAKGVVLSNAHAVDRSLSYVTGLQLDASDVMFTCLPLFHNNAQMASVLPAVLARGRTAVHRRFSVSRFWADVAASEATRFTIIGRMANQLLDAAPADLDRAHRVRTACVVPAPHGGDAFTQRFGIRVVSQYYGCTEMIPLPPDIRQPERPGSCGMAGDGFECAVVDGDGEPVPDGVVGELVSRPVRPSGVMSGYLDMPEATLHAFRGLWFHTGDAVRRDAEGFYYLVGRLKDVIRRKGENISASEVERIATRQPGIADAAAVGVPDEWGEEALVLFVEVAVGSDVDIEAVRGRCQNDLPDFMVPDRIVVVGALPRNALGRVEKYKLSEDAR